MRFCDVINYLVLAMIVSMVFYLLLQIVNDKEHMTIVSEKAPVIEKPVVQLVAVDDNKLTADVKRGEAASTPPGMGCPVQKNDDDVDGFIRRSLLQNAKVCKAKPDDREDLEKYRNDFFGFRNSINQTSHSDDMVDRINDMYLSGNSDISRNHKGVAIKDLFDGLTKGNDVQENQCIRMPHVDSVTQDGHYKRQGFRGETYTRDNWVYDQEKVNNGGEFYGNIYAVDPSVNEEMVYYQ